MRHPFKTDSWDARNFVTDFCKKNVKFQLLPACQPQNALFNFLKKSTFSTRQKCEIALSCRRDAYFRNATLLQTNSFFFLRFFLICVAPARDAHFSSREPPKWLQNEKNWLLKKRSDFCLPEEPQNDPKRTPK